MAHTPSSVWQAEPQRSLVNRVNAVRAAMRRHFLAEGCARLGIVILILFLGTLLLDWWLELSLLARIATWIVAITGITWLTVRHLVRPLTLRLEPLDIAAALDTRRTTTAPLAPRVASVLQLPSSVEATHTVSPELVERAVRENAVSLEQEAFTSHLSRQHLFASIAIAVACIAIGMATVFLLPEASRLWADRWILGSDRPWPRDTRISVVGVENGRLIVPRGEPATLQVKVTSETTLPEAVWIRMTTDGERGDAVSLTRFADDDFRFDLPPQQRPSDVEVWGGDGRAEPFRIEPMDRPRIVSLSLSAKHPREPQPKTFRFSAGEGNVRLLPRTTAHLQFRTNTPVESVRIDSRQSDVDTPLSFTQIAPDLFEAHWTFEAPVQARVTLTASESRLVSHPQPVSIGEQADRPPRVGLRYRGVRQRITPQATIPVTISARDDFGVHLVSLHLDPSGTVPSATMPESSDTAILPTTPDAVPPDETDIDDTVAAPSTPTGQAAPEEEPVTADESDPGTGNAASVPAASTSPPDPAPSGPPVKPDPVSLYGPASPATEVSIELDHEIEVEPLSLQPGMLLKVQIRSTDDCYQGPQLNESPQVIFRIVKPEELFREILLRQQQLRARLRKAADQAEELETRMQLTATVDDAAELLRSHQLTSREVTQVTAALDASVDEMRLNRLGGPETWHLIDATVLRPLHRLDEQQMTAQRQALQSLVSGDETSLETILSRQQEIVAELDRILKNMAQWDSFIDVVNQLDAVIKLESAVRQQTELLRQRQVESLFD